jgi:hypothetical protein
MNIKNAPKRPFDAHKILRLLPRSCDFTYQYAFSVNKSDLP